MADRLTWRMVRFNSLGEGPAYVDLGEVAAVVQATKPDPIPWPHHPELDVARGSIICLKSGRTIPVKETADAVFEEVHRYRTEVEPAPARMKYGSSGPNETAEPPVELSDISHALDRI